MNVNNPDVVVVVLVVVAGAAGVVAVVDPPDGDEDGAEGELLLEPHADANTHPARRSDARTLDIDATRYRKLISGAIGLTLTPTSILDR